MQRVIRAEFFSKLNVIWILAFFLCVVLTTGLQIRQVFREVLTQRQLGVQGYNPWFETAGVAMLVIGYLFPLVMYGLIYMELKRQTSAQWTYASLHIKKPDYLFGKLIALLIKWFFFVLGLYILVVFDSFCVSEVYPEPFLGYHTIYPYLLSWFFRYYLCSCCSIAICFVLNAFIKNKAVFLTLLILIPYAGSLFGQPKLFFPMSYSFFTVAQLAAERQLGIESGYILHFQLFSVYETLSSLLMLCIGIYIYFFPTQMYQRLSKY